MIVDRGLHGGARAVLRVAPEDGPTTLGVGDDRAPLHALSFVGEDRGTDAILPSGRRLRTVEHLLAAVAGTAAWAGVRLDVEGDEVPLADGGARAFAELLAPLGRPRPGRRVLEECTFEAHGLRLTVAPAPHLSVSVAVEFPADRFGVALAGTATWDGDVEDFRVRIASARTFGARRELEALRAAGLAAHVPPGVVVALDMDDPARAPTDEGEPVRHKLLDAIGDLATLGPVVGAFHLARPSHRAIHALLPAISAILAPTH